MSVRAPSATTTPAAMRATDKAHLLPGFTKSKSKEIPVRNKASAALDFIAKNPGNSLVSGGMARTQPSSITAPVSAVIVPKYFRDPVDTLGEWGIFPKPLPGKVCSAIRKNSTKCDTVNPSPKSRHWLLRFFEERLVQAADGLIHGVQRYQPGDAK